MARVVDVGGAAHYVVPDGDFLRHVEAAYVDRQIVALLKERFLAMRDVIAEGIIHLTGQEDLFTRASIDHAIQSMDKTLESGGVDIDQLRTALWMMKFRAIVDVHGDVVRLDAPGWESDDGGS